MWVFTEGYMSPHLRELTSLYRNKLAHWLEEQFQNNIFLLFRVDTSFWSINFNLQSPLLEDRELIQPLEKKDVQLNVNSDLRHRVALPCKYSTV